MKSGEAKAESKQKKSDGEQKSRYIESQVIKKHLKSTSGIPFLLSSVKESTRSQSKDSTNVPLHAKIEEIIDFYTSWTNSFPVRKNVNVSKYEFLKCVEEYCSKDEVLEGLEDILKDSGN